MIASAGAGTGTDMISINSISISDLVHSLVLVCSLSWSASPYTSLINIAIISERVAASKNILDKS